VNISDIDHAMAVYIFGILVGVYGLFLFGSYWINIGKASEVYLYVMFLLLGIAVTCGVDLVVRINILNGNQSMIMSWWWPLRKYPLIVPAFFIVVRMSQRWKTTRKQGRLE
jgi:uncharacterized membrane protein YbjE (DUF340 family)